ARERVPYLPLVGVRRVLTGPDVRIDRLAAHDRSSPSVPPVAAVGRPARWSRIPAFWRRAARGPHLGPESVRPPGFRNAPVTGRTVLSPGRPTRRPTPGGSIAHAQDRSAPAARPCTAVDRFGRGPIPIPRGRR